MNGYIDIVLMAMLMSDNAIHIDGGLHCPLYELVQFDSFLIGYFGGFTV